MTARRRSDRSIVLLLALASSLCVIIAGCRGSEPHTSSGSAHDAPTVRWRST